MAGRLPKGIRVQTTYIDKKTWGPGPWQSEPDFESFRWCGLDCYVKRLQTTGHLNGYVGVGPEHKLHGVRHDFPYLRFWNIHGGLTYSGPGELGDVWYFGFDCGRATDYKPAYSSAHPSGVAHYRKFDYVKMNCRRLAKVLRQFQDKFKPQAAQLTFGDMLQGGSDAET